MACAGTTANGHALSLSVPFTTQSFSIPCRQFYYAYTFKLQLIFKAVYVPLSFIHKLSAKVFRSQNLLRTRKLCCVSFSRDLKQEKKQCFNLNSLTNQKTKMASKMCSPLWIIGLFVIVSTTTTMMSADARIVHKIRDMFEPVPERVGRCRSTCLQKFLVEDISNAVETTEACSNEPNCFMCWDFCKILHSENRAIGQLMCNNHTCVSIYL